MVSLYEELSRDRKEGQKKGKIPSFFNTAGYQLFLDKYLHQHSIVDQYSLIAETAARHMERSRWEDIAGKKFFDLLWKGWLSPSTPILSNMGTSRGLPVSCSGNYIQDSIDGFYRSLHETAILTKYGFGTSSYLGHIRPRGSKISIGGKSSGTFPVLKAYTQAMQDVAQGSTRRGAWAGYLPIGHSDFNEWCDYLLHHPDKVNVGWIVNDDFINKLNLGDEEALRLYQKALKTKMVTGKGYFFFVDKANELKPLAYQLHDLDVKASNLCTEITLHSSLDYTFTCVLSSMNVAKYDEWKDSDAVYWAIMFLNCVAKEFINEAEGIPGLEKAVNFTKKGMALGLGQCGFHTYLQEHYIPFESVEAQFINTEIAHHIQREATKASRDYAEVFGKPDWCKGTELANTHLTAIAPTKSTALIMGGISEGINPDPAMTFTQYTAGGEVDRIAPAFLNFLKKKGLYNDSILSRLIDNFGSVQDLPGLSEQDKLVFRTGFEMDQRSLLRLASQRQKYIDQAQSINLFFAGDAKEEYISEVHKQAFLDPNIVSLYYIYSKTGVKANQHTKECISCM